MESVDDILSFVKSQADFHDRKASQFESSSPRRASQHQRLRDDFQRLSRFLESQSAQLDACRAELAERPAKVAPAARQLSLRLEDIEGLPDDLIKELSITDGDRIDFTIQSLIADAGGVMTLDQLLIALYRKTGEVHKRANLNARLYRMTTKGVVFNVPGRKGVYSTHDVPQDEAERLS